MLVDAREWPLLLQFEWGCTFVFPLKDGLKNVGRATEKCLVDVEGYIVDCGKNNVFFASRVDG